MSNAGGLGQISTVGLDTPQRLRAEIQRTKAMSDAPFGVKLPIGRLDSMLLLDAVLEERVAVVSLTGGNPVPCLRCESPLKCRH